MANLTPINFYNKWIQEFKTRGDAGITGAMMGLFLKDISDSCPNWGGSGGGGSDPIFPDIIKLEDLDENNAVQKEHNLETTKPLAAIWNSDGELLNGMNWSMQVIDQYIVEFTFEDLPAEGFPYSVLVWKKIDNIEEYKDYIDNLFIDFISVEYEGEQYHRQPVGWRSYTTLENGTEEDHLSADTNHNDDSNEYGINIVNQDTGTRYFLILENLTRYVQAGETYNILMNICSPPASQVTMNICGQNVVIGTSSYVINTNITVTESGLFYMKTDSDDDFSMYIYDLKVTRL